MSYFIVIIVLISTIFFYGCGFENLVLDRRDVEVKYVQWRNDELEKLKTKIAPYIGKDKENIRQMFGNPEDVNTYSTGKVKYNADEIWDYYVYKNRRRTALIQFFFRNSKLITVNLM